MVSSKQNNKPERHNRGLDSPGMSSNSGRGLSDLYARVSSGSKEREARREETRRVVNEEEEEERGSRDQLKRRRSISPVERDSPKGGRFERHRDRYERDTREGDGSHERRDRDGRDHRERDRERDRDRDYHRDRDRRDYRSERERSDRPEHRDRYERDNRDRYDRSERRESRFDRTERAPAERFDQRNDRPRGGYEDFRPRDDRRVGRYSSSASSSVQIPFDRFARLSPWNGSACPLEERTRHLRNWDHPPSGFERVSADKAKATGLFPPPGNVAKIANYLPPTLDPARMAMLQLLTGGTGRLEESSHLATAPASINALTANNPAIVKQARRFYLGNLPNPLHESQLTDFLERNLSGLAATGPDAPKRILSLNVSTDRTYAFVEVKTAEDATMAMNLDGVVFQGVQLKVRRPKEYHLAMTAQQEESTSTTNAAVSSPALTSSNAAKMELLPRPLILSEIPDFLTEAHLRALMGMVAELRQFVYLKAQGVVVFEFVEDEQGEEWSAPLLKHTQGSIFVGPFEMKLERLVSLYADETEAHERLRNVLSCFNLQPGYATAPHSTSIVQLLNLVTVESLQAAADEIEADLLTELKTFTAHPEQLELFLPRPRPSELVPGVGRVFVKFPGGVEEAVRAASELAGRVFDGRTCIVSFFPEDKYEKRQF